MNSSRPYFVRAVHEWISDNGLTPYIFVDAGIDGVSVPRQYVDEGGKIAFNISYSATEGLQLGNEYIQFNARFRGIPFPVHVPISAVIAVYARETGTGMSFQEDPLLPSPVEEGQLVEENEDEDEEHSSAPPKLQAIKSKSTPPRDHAVPDGDDSRPTLRIVK